MAAYRLIRPNEGWVRALWHRDYKHPLDVGLALSNVQLLPGVSVGPGYVELPHTTWMLDSVRTCLELMGLEGPRSSRRRLSGALWAPKREPYGFQWDGVYHLLDAKGALLCDDMGLGKSAQAIIAAETVRAAREGRPGIIIAPLFTRGTWQHELEVLGAIDSPEQFCALESRDLNHDSFRRDGVRWYFVHYDVVRMWWSQIMLDPKRRPVVSILDEAHFVRNSRTDRAKGVRMIAGQCPYRFILTGTPVENRPQDLWNLLVLATGARTWGSPNAFRQRYSGAIYNGYGLEDQGPTHVEELRKRIEPFFLRRTKAQVQIELPAMTRSVQYVPLDSSRQYEHDEVLGTAGIEAVVRAVTSGGVREVLPVLTRLRQVTSEAKLSATEVYVRNLLEQEDACVIFCWERATAEALKRRLKGVDRAVIDGSVDQATRDWRIRRFQDAENGGIDVLIATYGALAEGVTLHRSRVVVLHDLDYVLSKMLQGEARIHRVGQKRACQSVWMVAEHSIDSLLLPILFNKAQMSNELLDMTEGVEAFEQLGLRTPEDRVEEMVQQALRAWEVS